MIDINAIEVEYLFAALVTVIIVFTTFIFYVRKKEKDAIPEMEEIPEDVEVTDATGPVPGGKKKRLPADKKKDGSYEHNWLLTTLKGHTASVNDISFSQDGKKFVSVSCDRNVFIWKVSDFSSKERKCSRQLLDFDTATKAVFASDSQSLIFSMKRDNKLGVYKITRKGETTKLIRVESVDFPTKHVQDISHIGISPNGKYLMSASPDNKIFLYDIHGSILKVLEPKVSTLYHCAITPDGRFLSVSGFTPDAFIYEPQFSRDGNFVDCKKVFDLSGHNSGVFGVVFNQDSSRAVTASKDGYWRVFDTDIRYAQGQDSSILRKGYWEKLKGSDPGLVKMAMSPSGGAIAISHGSTVKLISTEDETKDFATLESVHSGNIEALTFSSCGQWLASCGDKYIRIFHNVPEHHSSIVRLRKSIQEVGEDSARRRIQEQIDASEKKLAQFEA